MDESWTWLVPEGPREPRLNQHACEIHQTYGKTMENMGKYGKIFCVWRFLAGKIVEQIGRVSSTPCLQILGGYHYL
jgi:hypothetical protein